ncbi:MAG: hypothetical protein WD904_11710 [Dehalococcoidia bacterium]
MAFLRVALGVRRGLPGKIVVAMLLGGLLVLTACSESNRPELTFFNNTDSLICFYETEPVQGACPEVMPHSKVQFRGECSQSGEQPMVVVLTSAAEQREVYRRTASCQEWKESGTLIIERREDGFLITDSLPD